MALKLPNQLLLNQRIESVIFVFSSWSSFYKELDIFKVEVESVDGSVVKNTYCS